MSDTMTEFEKMRAGLRYRNPDASLFAIQAEAAVRNKAINDTLGSGGDPASLRGALKEALGAFGESFCNPPIHFEYGKHIFIGDLCLINSNARFMDGADIRIGDHTLVSPDVKFVTAGHPVVFEERYIFDENGDFDTCYSLNKPITLGNGCWIGAGAIILGGVTIGDGTVVGAGSVVTKSLPERVVAAGNPARVIRELGPARR